MRKILLSLTLVLVLAASLAVPVTAFLGSGTEPTNVRLSSTYITIAPGATRQLTATVSPSDADTSLTWSSDNSSVATVSSDGLVTGVRTGEANITVRTSNGRSTICHVTVKNENASVSATKIQMSMSKMTVRIDQTRLLYVIFTPVDSTEDVYWSTSNSNVAVVDAEGNVRAMGPGTCTISATTTSGGAVASCEVTVPGNVVTGINKDATTNVSVPAGELLSSAAVRTTIAQVAKETKSSEVGYATFTNKSGISPETINAAVYAATEANRNIRLRFVTTDEDGKIQGTIVFDPTAATERTSNLLTEVHLSSSKISATKTRFGKYFSNKVAVLQLSNSGSFGLPVNVAAKVNLSGMDTSNLHFYTYDTATNKYNTLNVSGAWVDKNGYLQFTTNTGGVIVVSEGALR